MTDRPLSSFEDFPDQDSDWSQEQWKSLLGNLVNAELTTWKDVCSLVLGHLNPSQVGTSIASKKPFQRHFPKKKIWEAVRQWHFDQPGVCNDCGTRLELQADHIIPKEITGKIGKAIAEENIRDPSVILGAIGGRLAEELENSGYNDIGSDSLRKAIMEDMCKAILAGERDQQAFTEVADRLDNMLLRCRRCNVVRRPSHGHGGETFLTAEAALMWVLLVKKPKTYQDFANECRAYGMTMANIRFEEAWAMAMWLERDGVYLIDSSSKFKQLS